MKKKLKREKDEKAEIEKKQGKEVFRMTEMDNKDEIISKLDAEIASLQSQLKKATNEVNSIRSES